MKKGKLVRKRQRTEQIIKKTKTPKPSGNNENQYSEIPVPPFINKFVQLGITDDERPVKLFFILTKENVSKSKTNFETISWRVSRSDWGGGGVEKPCVSRASRIAPRAEKGLRP